MEVSVARHLFIMTASAVAVWALEDQPDPKVPLCRARGADEIQLYMRRAKAFVLGLAPEARSGAGPKLFLNLREAAAEAFIGRDPGDFVDDDKDEDETGTAVDPRTPRGQNSTRVGMGWRRLLRELKEAFPRGTIQELPLRFNAFFKESRMRGAGHQAAMSTSIRNMERSKAE